MLRNRAKIDFPDHLLYVGTLGLVGLMVLSGAVASSIHVNADDNDSVVTTASVTVAASCSMTATIDTPHNATLANGVYSASTTDYADGIGKTTIATFCNDNSGYAIYAIGFTGDSYTGADHTKLIGQTTSEEIATGTATSGSTSNWAMKLVKETDSTKSYNPANLTITNGYDDYSAIPDTYTKVANYTSTTDQTLGSVLSTTYAAYISGTQVADTYIGKVKYILVHPNNNDPSSYIVNFVANGGTGTMTAQKITYGTATALTSNGFTAPTGYVFSGWNTAPDGSGTSYTNGQSVTSIANAGSSITLYAQWVEPAPTNCVSSPLISTVAPGITYMQDITSSNYSTILSNMSTTTSYKIKDSRDEQNYCIAKLADGKLWMTSNLNIDGGTALSASDTDVEASYISSFTDSNNLTKSGDTIVLPASDNSSSSFSTDNYSYVYNTGNTTDTYTSPGCYSYYSWDAATLGSGRTIATENTDAPYSICPKGWRLPTSGSTSSNGWKRGDFYALATAYGANLESNYYEDSATFYNNAGPGTTPNFLLAGGYGSGSFYNGGSYGGYWSATSRSDTSSARSFLFSSSSVDLANYSSRDGGQSVRCVYRAE